MVCAKCQKKLKATELATPGVKNKNDMYYGSPSSTLGGGAAKGKATLGTTGVGKVRYVSSLWWYIILDLKYAMPEASTNDTPTEQTSQRQSEKSICGLLFVMWEVQDQDGAGEEVLPKMCISEELYVLFSSCLTVYSGRFKCVWFDQPMLMMNV